MRIFHYAVGASIFKGFSLVMQGLNKRIIVPNFQGTVPLGHQRLNENSANPAKIFSYINNNRHWSWQINLKWKSAAFFFFGGGGFSCLLTRWLLARRRRAFEGRGKTVKAREEMQVVGR